MKQRKTKVDVSYAVDGVNGRPCSNAKFMHVAGLPGMLVKTSHDNYYMEETTSVYLGDELMAERIMGTVHFPGEKSSVNCFLFGYRKEIENDTV